VLLMYLGLLGAATSLPLTANLVQIADAHLQWYQERIVKKKEASAQREMDLLSRQVLEEQLNFLREQGQVLAAQTAASPTAPPPSSHTPTPANGSTS